MTPRCAGLLTMLLVGAPNICPLRSASAAPAAPPPDAILHCGGPITAVAFSPDGRLLAVGTAASPDVQVWEAGPWRLRHSLRQQPALGGGQTGCGALAFLPDGRLATATDNVTGPTAAPYAEVRLWSPGAGVLQQTLTFGQATYGFCPPAITGLAASPDGRTLLGAAAPTSDLVCWNVATKATSLIPSSAFALPRPKDPAGAFEAVAFSPDGHTFAARYREQSLTQDASAHDDLLLWNAQTHASLRFLPLEDNQPSSGLAYAPDGTLLATTGASSTSGVIFANGRTGKPLPSVASPDAPTCLAFDPATGAPAFGTATGAVFGVALRGSAAPHGQTPLVPILPGGDGSVCALALSRAGLLAVGYPDGTVRVWRLSDGGKWDLRPAETTAEATTPGESADASGSPPLEPRPTLIRIDPASFDFLTPMAANDPTITLDVAGSGFMPGATIEWGGQRLPTTFLSDTRLEATVATKDALSFNGVSAPADTPRLPSPPNRQNSPGEPGGGPDTDTPLPVLVRNPGGRPSRFAVFVWTETVVGG